MNSDMIMDSESGEAGTSLLALPYEILLKVLRNRDGRLTHDDFKALRLTCRHFAYGPTIACLFHTIGISRLQRDIDNFIAIASHPRLAEQVRVIVWHELLSSRETISRTPTEQAGNWFLAFEQDIHRTLDTQVKHIDWHQASTSARYNPQVEYLHNEGPFLSLAQLFQAASSMRGIHTVISKPMHKDRRLTSRQDTGCYPLTAQALAGWYLFPSGVEGGTSWSNFGFYAFLLPLILKRPASHPITRLCFSDESLTTSLVRMQYSLHGDSLRHLTHLDFCISGPDIPAGSDGPRELLQLGECIRAAHNLRSLHICSENGMPYDIRDGLIDVILIGRLHAVPERNLPAIEPKDPDFKWAYLRELRLSGRMFPPRTLRDFMRRQAHSLKKVELYDCQFTVKDLCSIAKMNSPPENLHLESFVILISEAGDADPGFDERSQFDLSGDENGLCDPLLLPHCISEKQLVDFLNGSFASLPAGNWSRLATELEKIQPRQLIYTHAPVFDHETCYTGLVCDTRARCGIISELYDSEDIKALDIQNGDIRDPEGYSFQAGTDFHPSEHSDGRYPKLWKDNLDGLLWEDGEWNGDTEFKPFDYVAGDLDSLSEEFDDGLRWVVARDPEGAVYYWQEKDDADIRMPDISESSPFPQYTSPKYKTEVWRFTHHSGETAVGRDPLEYWADWDGEEAGDVAEALPEGYTMRAFINYTASRKSPEFQCSKEYIEARGGVRYNSWSGGYDHDLPEENIFEEFVNRHDWLVSELTGWKWGSSASNGPRNVYLP